MRHTADRLRSSPLTARAARRRRVLAVVEPAKLAPSLCALLRAREVARRRDAELHLLCVMPARDHVRARPLDGLGRLVDRFERDEPKRLRATTTTVRAGYATTLATDLARELGAEVLVAGALRGSGGHWARVARRANVPVLVARPRRSLGSMLAATDFTDERFPVFGRALELAAPYRADSSVVVLHNVDPDGRVFTRGFPVVLAERAIQQLREARTIRIKRLAARAPFRAHGKVSSSVDPVTAIVEHADRHDTDLVLVGAHAALPGRRGPRRNTANRVVERLASSALVLPLSARGLGA